MSKTSELGFFAEHYVTLFLKERGYEILDQNYRKPWGEIDIVARKDGVLVFVEVKANKREVPGFNPELRVNHDKAYRMTRIARTYLAHRKFPESQPWQLDIIGVTFVKERGVAKFTHFKNIEV